MANSTLRAVSTLLMLMALLLPVAPAGAQALKDEGADVHAANVPGGGPLPPGVTVLPFVSEPSDCTVSQDGTARYFLTVQSTAGTDILNATGRLIFPGLLPFIPGQVVNMTNGDLEAQASDGQFASGCTPGVPDGHANDLGSPFIATGGAAGNWSLILSAPGFVPRTFPALPTDDLVAPGCGPGNQGGGPAQNAGCLISMGTIQLQPLAAPAGRGVVAGTIFGTNGQPTDGAVVVLTDAARNIHTRVSGTNCDGTTLNPTGAATLQTGFYCFSDSTPELFPRPSAGPLFQNDGLGLPIGPAQLVVVNNTATNCVTGAPATACGFLPAFVSVNVVAAAVTGQDITLANKFAPAAPAPTGAGAFGYVVNDGGQGVGGLTVTATTAAGAVVGGPCPTGAPVGPVVTSPQTGLWAICGLGATAAITFTLTGPGINSSNTRGGLINNPQAITRTTTAAGTYIDPNWVIVGQGPQAVTIPIVGNTIIRGQVLGCQDPLAGSPVPGPGIIAPGLPPTTAAAGCIPVNGPGAFALLWSANTRSWAGATMFNGPPPGSGIAAGGTVPGFAAAGWPAITPLAGLPLAPFTSAPPIIAAAALDAGGNYCFGAAATLAAAPTGPGLCIGQPPITPGDYLVTIVDDRPLATCLPGFQPAPGAIGPAPCGQMMQTSQIIHALSDQIVTVNFALQPRFSPGAIATDPAGVAGVSGVFGYLRDASVPGGAPVQGGTVFAAPIPGGTAAVIAAGLVPGASAAVSLAGAQALGTFAGTINITNVGPPGLQGLINGAVLSSTPPLTVGGGVTPPYPGSDPFGLYRIIGMTPGTMYAVFIDMPSGSNNCAPNNINMATPVTAFTGQFYPTNIGRCVVAITAPAAGVWAVGADFAFSGQNLRGIEGFESPDIDRRLENVVPLVTNGAPTAAMGGWELQTQEIHVTNAGPLRTVAEVRFYQSDGLGGAGVLAGTQTADLVPGGGRKFRAPEMPGGFLGWVGIWAFDADGPAGVYGKSALVAVVRTVARNAGGAMEESDGVPREEITSPNQNISLPLAYRNYGGTANKWNSLITVVNVGESAPVTFYFFSQDRIRNDARRCANGCIISKYANRGGVILLNLGDNTDPDIALLAEGTYSVEASLGGSLQPSARTGDLPGWQRTTFPGGMVISAFHLTVEGKMLADGRTQTMLGPSSNQGPQDAENAGVLYAPLLFKNYNGWSSGLVVTVMTTSGGQSSTATVAFYDEGGQFLGQLSDRLSRATMYVYLPAIEFLPDKFRGTAIIHVGCSGCDFPGFAPGFSATSMVNHVNYDRNTAMSYDGIGISAVVNRTEGLGELPCISIGFTTCAWAGDVVKTYTVSRDNVQIGPQTGVRLYNPDPQSFGTPATVVVHFIDDTGVIWNEATQVVTIPPFGVNTIFPMYDARLPEIFSGSMRISASGNYIVGIAQTVDYSASGVDAGGAYNLQYQSGRTR